MKKILICAFALTVATCAAQTPTQVDPGRIGWSLNPNTNIKAASLAAGTSMSAMQPVVNVAAYGAVGDGLSGAASYTAGSSTVSVPSASYTQADVGKILLLKNAGLQGTSVPITACAVASNVVTLTATNSFRSTEMLVPTGFTGGCAFLNNQLLTVGTTALSGTSFTANFTAANLATASDSGTGSVVSDLRGTIATVIDATHVTGATAAGYSSTMTPQVTISNGTAVWATDNTAAIQSAFNAAANHATFPPGEVGNKIPQVFFPQGEFHFTGTVTRTYGQIAGIPGAGGTRVVWDGVNNGIAFEVPSNAAANESMSGIEFSADSYFFAPAKWFDINTMVDAQTHWSDIHFSQDLVAAVAFNAGFVNFHFDHVRFDAICGTGMAITVPAGTSRSNFNLDQFTVDFGGSFQTAAGCTASSFIDFNVAASGGGWSTLRFANARIENQVATRYGGTNPAVIRFLTGGGSGAGVKYIPVEWNNLTFNFNNTLGLMSTDDTSGNNCPIYTLTQVMYAGLSSIYQSGNGTWCGGPAVAQPPTFASGNYIESYVGDPGGSTTALGWSGEQPENLVTDSEINYPSTYWTLASGWSTGTQCGFAGTSCFELPGTGSAFPTLTVTQAIPVTPGLTYYFAGWVNCSKVTSGGVGWYVSGTGFTTQKATCSGTDGTFGGLVTIPSGTTSVTFGFSSNSGVVASGSNLIINRPQFNLSSSAVNYQPNPVQTLASSSAPGMVQCGTGTSCSGGVLSVPAQPLGSSSTPGLLECGTGTTCASGVLNVNAQPQGSSSTAGILKCGTGTTCSGGTISVSSTSNLITSYDSTGNSANLGGTTIWNVPSSQSYTYYSVCGYEIVSQAAITNSTMPTLSVRFYDATTGNLESYTIGYSSTANTTAASTGVCGLIHPGNSTTVAVQNSGYASSGTTPMLFNVHATITGVQ
jgi:hypothetical protein